MKGSAFTCQGGPDTRSLKIAPEPGGRSSCLLPFLKHRLELPGPLPGAPKGDRIGQELVMMLRGHPRAIGLIGSPLPLSASVYIWRPSM